MADFDEAGGVPAVMKVLEGRLHLGCRTVTGATVEENLRKARVRRPEVIRSVDQPVFRGGLAILRGSLASSAVVRPTVVPEQMMKHTGPARTFDSMEACLKSLEAGQVKAGEVIVLRYEGPRGGPGLTEVFKVLGYMGALGLDKILRAGDRREDLRLCQGPVHLPGIPRGGDGRADRPGPGRRSDRGGHPGTPAQSPGAGRGAGSSAARVDTATTPRHARLPHPVCAPGGTRRAWSGAPAPARLRVKDGLRSRSSLHGGRPFMWVVDSRRMPSFEENGGDPAGGGIHRGGDPRAAGAGGGVGHDVYPIVIDDKSRPTACDPLMGSLAAEHRHTASQQAQGAFSAPAAVAHAA